MRAEILRLSAPPFKISAPALAQQFGVSERTVQRVRAAGRSLPISPDPRPAGFLGDAEMEECATAYWAWRAYADDYREAPLETITSVTQAFRVFFERFSGFQLASLHEEWVRMFFIHDRLLLNVPPRHAKSEIMTIWLTIFETAFDRNLQTLIISQTLNMARKFSNKIAWHFEFNAKMIAIFGRFRPIDQMTPWRPLSGELMVEGRTRETESGDLTIQIRGAGQQILGMETDRVKGDDMVDRESSYSESTREKLSEYWHGDALSRQSPIARITQIGQRIHFLDLYGELEAETVDFGKHEGKPLYHHINYPAILDYTTEEVLWPDIWPFEKLMRRRNELKRKNNSWLWDTMYQQNPIPPDERLVLDEWIYGDPEHIGCLDKSRPAGMGMASWDPRDGEKAEWWVRVMSLDPSPSRAAGLIVADVYHSRDVFRCGIIEAVRASMDVRTMVRQIERVTTTYRPQYLIFEQNAAQRWFLQDPDFIAWKNSHNVRVIPHTTGKHKTDPNFGLQSLAVAFEYGRIRFPFGDHTGREMSRLLIDEATTYPYGPYSDLLMALWFIAFNHAKLTPPPGRAGADEKSGPGFGAGGRQGWAAFTR